MSFRKSWEEELAQLDITVQRFDRHLFDCRGYGALLFRVLAGQWGYSGVLRSGAFIDSVVFPTEDSPLTRGTDGGSVYDVSSALGGYVELVSLESVNKPSELDHGIAFLDTGILFNDSESAGHLQDFLILEDSRGGRARKILGFDVFGSFCSMEVPVNLLDSAHAEALSGVEGDASFSRSLATRLTVGPLPPESKDALKSALRKYISASPRDLNRTYLDGIWWRVGFRAGRDVEAIWGAAADRRFLEVVERFSEARLHIDYTALRLWVAHGFYLLDAVDLLCAAELSSDFGRDIFHRKVLRSHGLEGLLGIFIARASGSSWPTRIELDCLSLFLEMVHGAVFSAVDLGVDRH